MQRSRPQDVDETSSDNRRSPAPEDAQEHLTARRTDKETLSGRMRHLFTSFVPYPSLYIYTLVTPSSSVVQGYIPDLVELVKKGVGEEEEGAVEAVGILSNLSIAELDFAKIVSDLQLLPFLTGKLKVNQTPRVVSI